MEEEKTQVPIDKEALIRYAIKMRERGDRYRSILTYLENNCSDKEMIHEIIGIVDELETKKSITVDHSQGVKDNWYFLLGYVFIAAGVILFILLWNTGWLSTLPIIMVAMGFYGIKESKIQKPR